MAPYSQWIQRKYHQKKSCLVKNKYLNYLDVLFSNLLILSNVVLLFMGHWILPYSVITIIFTLIAILFYFIQSKHYNIYHSVWHIFSAGICYFSLMTYISYLIKQFQTSPQVRNKILNPARTYIRYGQAYFIIVIFATLVEVQIY